MPGSTSDSSSSSSLIVKASHGASTRRITFGHAVNFSQFRAKLAAMFSLAPSALKLSFTDDDGDEIEISSQSCLREAISFFSDEDMSSQASSRSSGASRCVMRISVQVLYDGPGLSDYDAASYSGSERPISDRFSRLSGYERSDEPREHSHRDHRYRGGPQRSPPGQRRASFARRDPGHDGDSYLSGSPSDYAPSGLRRSTMRGAGDGRQEHSRRWLADLPRGFPSPGSVATSAIGLERQPSHTQAPDEELHCSRCHALMENLRYVCSACGPIKAELAVSDDGTQRDAPLRATTNASESAHDDASSPVDEHASAKASSSSSSSEPDDGQSPTTSLGSGPQHGFELCSACVRQEGAAHAATTTSPRHAFREIVRDQDQRWREVCFDDQVDCSSCGERVPENERYKCLTCARFELCATCFGRVGNLHGGHTFQSSCPRPTFIVSSSSLGPAASLEQRVQHYRSLRSNSSAGGSIAGSTVSSRSRSTARHSDCMCFGCLREVVGVRYHCSDCRIDLCESCESGDPAQIMPQTGHEASHILLKIQVPITDAQAVDNASERVDELERGAREGRRGRSPAEGRHHGPPPPHMRGGFGGPGGPPPPPFHGPGYGPAWGYGPPGPPFHHHHGPPPPWHHRKGPPPPSVYLINAGTSGSPTSTINSLVAIPPTTVCAECRTILTGERYMCASCPTSPAFELCANCEKTAASRHDASHVFVHLRKAPSRPMPPGPPLLPPYLYHEDGLDETDPLHKNVRCDGCSDQIRSIWWRCGSCAGLDLCSTCYSSPLGRQHEERHPFVKLTKPVDMTVFRQITQLDSAQPVALLQSVVF